jgi:hypothetical protein
VSDALLHGALRHAALAILPILTETANGFAKTDRKRGDGFEALLAAVGKLAVVFAANLGEQQLCIAENSGQRIVQLVTQCFAEGFLVVLIAQQRVSLNCLLGGLAQTLFEQIDRGRKTA